MPLPQTFRCGIARTMPRSARQSCRGTDPGGDPVRADRRRKRSACHEFRRVSCGFRARGRGQSRGLSVVRQRRREARRRPPDGVSPESRSCLRRRKRGSQAQHRGPRRTHSSALQPPDVGKDRRIRAIPPQEEAMQIAHPVISRSHRRPSSPLTPFRLSADFICNDRLVQVRPNDASGRILPSGAVSCPALASRRGPPRSRSGRSGRQVSSRGPC